MSTYEVKFSYTADGKKWGYRNNYKYECDLDNPLTHQLGVPKRKHAGVHHVDDEFEPLVETRPGVWSSVICPGEAKIPHGVRQFQIRVYRDDAIVWCMVDCVKRGASYIWPQCPISFVRFTGTCLDSVTVDYALLERLLSNSTTRNNSSSSPTAHQGDIRNTDSVSSADE